MADRSKCRQTLQSGLAAIACLLGSSVQAAAVENPTEWVRGIYAKYVANQAVGDALALLRPEASERLKEAMADEGKCRKLTKAICGLHFDPIANGQDFEIKDVVVTSVAKVGTAVPEGRVTARFSNFHKPQTIEFFFVKKGGTWLLDEVSSKNPGEKGWVLSKVLGKRG